MTLPTDEQLKKRAVELTCDYLDQRIGKLLSNSEARNNGHEDATLEALKVHHESLRLLDEARLDVKVHMTEFAEEGHANASVGSKILLRDIDAHIALLKSRLGITD